MAVTFLEVARGLVYDEAQKAAFAGDPAGYLAARGLAGLAADDVADAVRLAADNLPAPIARDITNQLDLPGDDGTHGLAALAAVEPPLTELGDPESLDGWGSPVDADSREAEVADPGDEGPEQDGTLEWPGRDTAGDAGDGPEGFGQGADEIADSDLAAADIERVGDVESALDGHAASTWDLDASDDIDVVDPLPTDDADPPEPSDLEPDAAIDPTTAAEPRLDDGMGPDGLGL